MAAKNELPEEAEPRAMAAADAKPLLTGPKRQHFLPKFYLDGFSKDGLTTGSVPGVGARDVRAETGMQERG